MKLSKRIHLLSSTVKFDGISVDLSKECIDLIRKYSASLPPYKRSDLALCLHSYIGILSPSIKIDDTPGLTKALTFVRNHLCTVYTYLVVNKKLLEIRLLLDKLVEQGFLSSDYIFPSSPKSAEAHKTYKEQKLDRSYLSRLGHKQDSADEAFKKTLSDTCTPEIAKRLCEHVYNFKHPKHHR